MLNFDWKIHSQEDVFSESNGISEVYRLWESNWESHYKEIGAIKDELHSDSFSRQQHVISIWKDKKPIGQVGIRTIMPFGEIGSKDSYLKIYPKNVLADFIKKDEKVGILSGFTINPEYTPRIDGLPTIMIMGAATIFLFWATGLKHMISTARIETGVHKLSYRFGATPLKESVSYMGQPVDLVYFNREKTHLAPSQRLEPILKEIFNVQILQGGNNEYGKRDMPAIA